MANHTNIGVRGGKLFKILNQLVKFRDETSTFTITPIETLRSEVEAAFDSDDTDIFILEAILGYLRQITAALNALEADFWGGPFGVWVTQYLRDEIDSKATDVQDICMDWFKKMIDDSKDVAELTVSLSTSPTAHADNVGTGTVVVSITEPFEGRTNERIVTGKYSAVCRSSAFDGGTTPGNEVLQVTCDALETAINVPVKFDEGLDLNRITDGSFEDWTSSLLDSWDEDAGDTTDVSQNTSDEQFGSSCLEMDGDGALTSIQISQSESAFAGYATNARLKPKRHYLLSAWIKTDGGTGIASGDTFSIYLDGTGYTTGSGEKISIAGADSADWTEYRAVVIMPADIPSDMELVIKYEGTPAAGAQVLVDGLCLAEMEEWQDAGLNIAVTRGLTDWVGGGDEDDGGLPHQDRVTFATTNALDALWQKFMVARTKPYQSDVRTHSGPNRMLPSASSASTEYAETLITA